VNAARIALRRAEEIDGISFSPDGTLGSVSVVRDV
jgi:hypothetical protein